MNKTMPARCATPLLATANEYQTPDTVFSKEFQDLCSFAMDQALVIEKASQATAASLNSYAIDFYKSSLWFAPAFNDLLDMAAQNLAFCMELQMNWLTLLTLTPRRWRATPAIKFRLRAMSWHAAWTSLSESGSPHRVARS